MAGIVRASPGHESHSRDREEELEPGFRETSVSFSRTIVLSKTLLQSLLFHPSSNLSRPVYWCGHIRCLDAGWRMKGVVIVVISDNINISSRASCLQCRALCLVVTGNLRTDGHLATEKLGHTWAHSKEEIWKQIMKMSKSNQNTIFRGLRLPYFLKISNI